VSHGPLLVILTPWPRVPPRCTTALAGGTASGGGRTRDPRTPAWWLHHYFPATARLEAARETPLSQLAELLGCRLDITPVPIPADCVDGFNAAYWRRPAAYLDPEIWQPMSALALIPAADRAEGQRRLRADLDSGEWNRRWGHLLDLGELDLGYRVVTAWPA
jgi:hypothetical protein